MAERARTPRPLNRGRSRLIRLPNAVTPVADLCRQAENDCVHLRNPFVVALAAFLVFSLATIAKAGLPVAQSNDPQTASKTKPVPPPEVRVDINHASVDELLKVPGMTPSWAGRIVRFRPYRTKQDLLDHGVLPSDVYDRIKDYIIAHRDPQ